MSLFSLYPPFHRMSLLPLRARQSTLKDSVLTRWSGTLFTCGLGVGETKAPSPRTNGRMRRRAHVTLAKEEWNAGGWEGTARCSSLCIKRACLQFLNRWIARLVRALLLTPNYYRRAGKEKDRGRISCKGPCESLRT